MPIPLRPFALSLLILPLAATAAAAAAEPARGGPLHPCHVADLKAEVLCASIPVWEDREAKAGRKIDLNVVVLPATGPSKAPDAVFFVSGGPGEAATGSAADFGTALAVLRETRDLVFVDSRGTGRSHPLDCPLPGSDDDLQGYLRDLFPLEPLRACLPKLAADANLALYSTANAMDDLDDVRAALGYERIDLLGGSYGTEAAQVYLHRHPDRVRSVVLFGYSKIDDKTPLYHARNAQNALDRLLDDCGADAACRAAFPSPRAELREVLARLDRGPAHLTLPHPKTGRPVALTLSRGVFTGALRSMQYSPALAVSIPLYVHRAFLGDYAPIVRRAIDYAKGDPAGFGLYFSVTCAEGVARFDPADVPRETAGTFLGDDRIRQQRDVCAFWPRSTLPGDHFQQFVAAAPALILSGWLDPATPPEWAAAAATELPNSVRVLVRDGAHNFAGLSHEDCFLQLITSFVRDGTGLNLDTSCARKMKRPPFTLKEKAAAEP